MNLILIALGTVAILLYDVPQLLQQRHWKELVVFSILLVFGVAILLLMGLGIHVPSPIRGIQYLITQVLHIGYP